MLAGRSVRHGKKEVKIGVVRNGNLHFRDGEILVATGDAGSTSTILGNLSLNTLVLEVGARPERTS